LFVTVGRAAGAGMLRLLCLLAQRATWPERDQLMALGISAVGTVLDFPLLPDVGAAPSAGHACGGGDGRVAAGHGGDGGVVVAL